MLPSARFTETSCPSTPVAGDPSADRPDVQGPLLPSSVEPSYIAPLHAAQSRGATQSNAEQSHDAQSPLHAHVSRPNGVLANVVPPFVVQDGLPRVASNGLFQPVSHRARLGAADRESNDAPSKVSGEALRAHSMVATGDADVGTSARVQPVGKLFHAGTLRWVRFARQAISNGTVEPMGHELTFRWDAGRDRTDEPPSPYAVCMTLSHALLDGGLKHRAPGGLFVSLDREALMSSVADALCAPHFIIQLPRTLPVDPEVTRRIAQLHAAGYAFALSELGGPDDPRWMWAPLVRYAKLQVARESPAGWAGWLRRAEYAELQVIVEGLTEPADYLRLRRLGVHRFQGPLIQPAQEESVRALPCCDAQILHKLNRLVEQGASRETLAMVSATDPALVIRLLMLQRIYAEGLSGAHRCGVNAFDGLGGVASVASVAPHWGHAGSAEQRVQGMHGRHPSAQGQDAHASHASNSASGALGSYRSYGSAGLSGLSCLSGPRGPHEGGTSQSDVTPSALHAREDGPAADPIGAKDSTNWSGASSLIGKAGAAGSWGASGLVGHPFTGGCASLTGSERPAPAATLADVLEALPYRVLSGWMRILRHSSFDPHESGRAWSASVREQMYNFRARLIGARACRSPQELEARVFGLYRRLCSREAWVALAASDESASPDLSGEAPSGPTF